MSLEERFDALMRQHELMFGVSLVPPNKPNLAPVSMRRCSKCHGLGHKTSVCPNKEFITLAQLEAAMVEENEDKSDHTLKETQEEVMEETREEDLLIFKEVLSPQKKVQDEPSIFFPTPPTPKTLNPNFCQSISEPLLKAPILN